MIMRALAGFAIFVAVEEKIIANVVAFALGSLTTVLGANVDEVYKLVCAGKIPSQMQSQETE